MIKMSYSTNGLLNLDLFSAIDAVENAGYEGIELSFDRHQFNPFELDSNAIRGIRQFFKSRKVKPACIATPTISFLADRPHEPSIICLDKAGRKQRIDLIKRGIEIAKSLEAPVVSFGSGFIRDEHIAHPDIDPWEILANSVGECLKNVGDIILTIEPEPGMLVETLEQGIDVVKTINSRQFQLHVDLCHVYCSEKDYEGAISKAAPYTKYLHVSDTGEGCNVKLLAYSSSMEMDFNFASYLVYFPDTCDFLFLDKDRAICFYGESSCGTPIKEMKRLSNGRDIEYVRYDDLPRSASPLDREINTYAVSVPGLSFYVLDRAKPVLRFLRSLHKGELILKNKVANTLTGKVHYHDIPGRGEIDFKRTFQVLEEKGFHGYATVELYHHVDTWREALHESISYLSGKDPVQNMENKKYARQGKM